MRERSPWRDLGAALARRGWRAIPILPGEKIPGKWKGTHWAKRWDWPHDGVPSAAMLKTYQAWPPCGIGIVLGRQADGSFVIVVDIDVRVPVVADEIEELARRTLGSAPKRVGLWPKLALFYRCSEETAKRMTGGYLMPGEPRVDPVTKKNTPLHRVEILAKPLQVVVYGRHPESRQDYSWTGGSPATLAPGELTLVTLGMLQSFLEGSERILVNAGGVVIRPASAAKPKSTRGKAKATSGKDQAKVARGDANPALHAGLLALLKKTGRVLKRRGDRVDILCPFADEHPDRGNTGTTLMPGGGIACHHATCDGRMTGDFIAKLNELAAEAGLDGPAIYARAAHPRQLEMARAEFEEIDDATLATLRHAPRPGGIQTEHQRQVRHAASAQRAALDAEADWERLVKAARERQVS